MHIDTMTLASARPLGKRDLIEIYERFSPALYRYAVRLLGDRETAEDCVSETFSRLLQAVRGGAGPKENVQAYLYRIAHNWVIDYYRRHQEQSASPAIDEIIDIHSNPSQMVSDRHEQERVRSAILRLSPEQQQVIALRFLEEMSHEDTAAMLGKTTEATRALQYRALASLRHMLGEEV